MAGRDVAAAMERRRKAKEDGTYNQGVSSDIANNPDTSNVRNVEEALERRRKAIEDGTYKRSTHIPYEPIERNKQLLHEAEKTEPPVRDFKGITNEGYRNYLENLQQKNESQDAQKWLEKQERNLQTLQDEKVRGLVGEMLPFHQNAEHKGALKSYQEARKQLEKIGYNADDMTSLLDTYQREQNAKRIMDMNEKVEANTGDFWGDAWESTKSVGAGLLSGFGYVEDALKTLDNKIKGEYSPIDTNSTSHYYGQYRDKVRGDITTDIQGEKTYSEEDKKNLELLQNEDVHTLINEMLPYYQNMESKGNYKPYSEAKNKMLEMGYSEDEIYSMLRTVDLDGLDPKRKNLASLYNAGMSVADSMAAYAVGGVVGKAAGLGERAIRGITQAIMSSSAAESTTRDAFNRTGSNEKAVLTGGASGAIEAATEKFSIDYFWDILKGTGKALTRETIVNLLMLSGIEGFEEMTAETLNTIVDRLINKKDSNYELNVQNYMEQGWSEEKARDAAFEDTKKRVWEAGEMGAIAGGISGGIGTVGNKIGQYAAGYDANHSEYGMYEATEKAKQYDDEKVQNALKQYQNRPSDYNAGKLLYEMKVVDEIKENLAKKEQKGEIPSQPISNENEVQKMDAQTTSDNVIRAETNQPKAVNTTEVKARMQQAKTADELVEAVREVEKHGTKEQIEEVRMYSEVRGAQMVTSGITTNEQLALANSRLTEEEAFAAGERNEVVAPEQLSLNGKIAYNEGKQRYNQMKISLNTISNVQEVKMAQATDNNGQTMTIKGLSNVEGEPIVQTDSGNVKLSDISFQNEAVGILYNNASTMGSTKGANTYVKFYPGNIMVNYYDQMVQSIMKDGELGLSIDNVIRNRRAAMRWIGEEGIRELYALGKEKTVAKNKQRTSVKRKGTGKAIDKTRSNTQAPLMKVFEQIAQKTGVDIEVSDNEISNVKGYFEESMSRIVLNSDENMFETVLHELGEFTDTWNTEGMQAFQNALLDWYFETYGDNLHGYVSSVQKTYQEHEGSKTYREAANEIVNDAISGLFATEKGVKDFTKWLNENRTEAESKTILQTITDFLRDLSNAIRKYISEHTLSSTARSTMQMAEDKAQALREQFLKALDEAVVNYQKADVKDEGGRDTRKHSFLTNEDIADFLDSGNRANKNRRRAHENGEQIILQSEAELSEFVSNSISGKMQGKVVGYGKVNDALADRVLKKSEGTINIKGFYLTLSSDDIRHGYATHEKASRKSNLDMSQAELVKALVNINDAEVKKIEKHKDNRTDVILELDMHDGNIVLVEVVSLSTGSIRFKTGWKEIKRNSLNSVGNKSSNLDSKSSSMRDSSASNTSIPQNQKNGTEKRKNSLKVSEMNAEYMAAVESGDMEAAQRLVDEVAKENGYTVKAYHGTGRADRVGTVFRPDRATSGPMAFFTDNKGIASNYARDKKDTSIEYDEEYDSYYTQFRVNRNGQSISVPELWKYLSVSEKNAIKEKAKHIKFDDDYENIIVDPNAEHGNGAWDAYTLNMHKGNALEALVDTWLETGDLYDNESDFVKVLELVGVKGVEYRDPNARYEKVYDTWLKIQNPFNTANVNQSFYDDLSEWIEGQDMSVYSKSSNNADMWDKNNQTSDSWLEKLADDMESNTTYAWTVIPDFVTDYFKEQGYDGIQDSGGKGGGEGHTVWVPFSSEQVKSADPVTYDNNGNVILLSERFNENRSDIRYSLKININEEISSYGVENKLNDYIGVQKGVIETLRNEQYFQNNEIVNKETGMKIRITPKGIRETLGNGKRFQTLPRELKRLKIATIRSLPNIIRRANLIEDNVKNSHGGNAEYAYLYADVEVNQERLRVKIDVRKTIGSNKFWMHNVEIKKDSDLLSPAIMQVLNENRNPNGSITLKNNKVKSELRHSLSDTTDMFDFFMELSDSNNTVDNTASILEAGAKAMQGKEVNVDSVKAIARKMKSEYKSKINVDTLADNLVKVFSYMQTQEKADYQDMLQIMTEVAMPVIEASTHVDEVQQENYMTFKKILRDMPICLSEQQKNEVAHYYDSYENFRRKMFGTLPLSDKGVSLDAQWYDLVEFSNGYLELDTAEADQPLALVDALEQMKPQMINNFGANNHEVAMDLSLRIYEEYFKAQSDNKVKALKDKMIHERAQYRDKTRKEYQKRLANIREQMREKTGTIEKRVAEVKAQHRISELQKKYDQEAAEYRYKIKRTGSELVRWIEKPTNKKHVPEQMKGIVLEFLDCIDFVSHRAKEDSQTTVRWTERMRTIHSELQKASLQMALGEKGGEQLRNLLVTLHPDFMPRLEAFIKNGSNVDKISQMEYKQLKELDFLMRTMKSAVTKANEMHQNEMYRYAAEAGEATIQELAQKKERKSAIGKVEKMLSLDMAEPLTVMKRLGDGAMSIYQEIRKGFDKRVELLRESKEYTENITKKIPKKKLSKWIGNQAEVHTVETMEGEIQLSTGQLLSLYLLSKRNQGIVHILKGGIIARSVGQDGLVAKLKGKKKTFQAVPKHVNQVQLGKMLSILTEEQKAFADGLQKFLATNCAEWGNEVHMKMYEYKKFMDEKYWPIKTFSEELRSKGNAPNEASAYAVKNLGFTNTIQNEAPQAIWIDDVLDTYVNHVTEMATYNAYLLPLSDAMKWFNYSNAGFEGEIHQYDGVRKAIRAVYGSETNQYFMDLLFEINGETNSDKASTIPTYFAGNFKKASVMANLSVILQQPTAYIRALNVLDARDVLGALSGVVKLKSNVNEALEHSGIAQWKSWGFFETYMGQSMKEVVSGVQTTGEKVESVLSMGAQKADEYTWGILWNACKREIRRTQPNLKNGSKEFYDAVTKRFDEVIDSTQVVDSILHKSPMMKSKGYISMEMAFMSEPIKSYNMMYRAADSPKKFTRSAMAWMLSGMLASMAASLIYAFRDDKDAPFGERYWGSLKEKLVDNLNPLSMIPYAKTAISLWNGYDAKRIDTEGIANVVYSLQGTMKKFLNPEESSKTWYGVAKQFAKGISYITGKPFFAVWREVESLIETIADTNIGETETASDLYTDLILEETGSKAYEKAYDKLYEMGKEETDIRSGVRRKLNSMYKAGEISEEDAKTILWRFDYEDVDEIIYDWQESM